MPFSFFKSVKNKISKNKNNENEKNDTAFIAGQYGGVSSQAEAAASDAMTNGMDLFRQAAKQKVNIGLEQKQGNLFEYIEAAKFNSDSALKGSDLKAYVTEAEGDPHSPADILVKKGKKVIQEVQAKSSKPYKEGREYQNSLKEMFKKRDKYKGMDKLTNKEYVEDIKRVTKERVSKNNIYSDDYKELNKNVTGELKADDVTSGGTSYKEAYNSAKNPKLAATMYEVKSVAREAGTAGVQAAAAGAIIGGGISTVKNMIDVSQGNKDLEEATREIMKDTTKAGVRGGAVGAGGTVVRHGAKKAGIKALQKSNTATAIAAGTIEVGVAIYDYAKGDISAEEAMEKIGQTGTSTASSIYVGAAAGAVFGPAGAAIGSVAGYIVASNVYQSCVAIFKHANLVEEEAARIVALYEESTKQLREQRQQFEQLIEERLEIRKEAFDDCFSIIDTGLQTANPANTAQGLAQFANLFGEKLQFEGFDEFDDYMKNTEGPLTL